MRYTTHTSPVSIRKRQLVVDHAAGRARFRRWVIALYLLQEYASLLTYVREDLHELAKSQIGHLATPEPLHALQRQVFDANEVEAVAEFMRGFEEPIPTLPGNTPMGTSQATMGRSPVTRRDGSPSRFPLSTQCPVQSGDLRLGHPEEQGAGDLASVAQCEESLQAEIHSHRVRYFLVWYWIGRFLNDRETEPEIAAAVSFDGDGLDRTSDFSGEHELERALSDSEAVTALVLPSGLCQGERRVLRSLLERRQTYPRALSCLVVEEGLVGQVEPLNDHLSSLGANPVPVLKAPLFLELRQVTLQLVVAWIRAVEPVVPTRQGHVMVPDLGGVFDTLDEHPVMLRAIQAVFECASQLLLALDVAFDGLLGDSTSGRDEVGAGRVTFIPMVSLHAFGDGLSDFPVGPGAHSMASRRASINR